MKILVTSSLSCFVILLQFFGTSLLAQAPEVTNVECRQLAYPSTLVEITYNVDAETETVHIQLLMSEDGGETWDVPVTVTEGDIGSDIDIGQNKRILWDAGREFLDQFSERMKARIVACDRNPGEEREVVLAQGVNIVLCWIPPGSFEMGSPDQEEGRGGDEGPVHVVTFVEGFWMSKFEITQAQWEAVMHNNPGEAEYGNSYGVGDNFPVYYISWNDIQQFEARINEGFRLPSESEWEYSCRAGTNTRYYWGNDFDGEYAWYDANAGGRTHEVGTRQPNAWGLYDMSGNVREWCEDWHHGNYNGAPVDGSAWVAGGGQSRLLRGGAWEFNASYCRSAKRSRHSPGDRSRGYGFRLVFGG